jgi:hypothetical protein
MSQLERDLRNEISILRANILSALQGASPEIQEKIKDIVHDLRPQAGLPTVEFLQEALANLERRADLLRNAGLIVN